MDKLDEKIISLRKQQQKKQNSNIEEGAYINNAMTEFVLEEILDNQFTVLIPSYFADMSIEDAKAKYPSEQRSQCIKTSPDTSVNLGVSLLDFPVSEEHLKQESEEIQSIIKKSNPATEFYLSGIEELEDFKLAWFEYKSFAIDGQMYNIMFIASVDNKMLHGMFNCSLDERDNWQDLALKMVKSIRRVKKPD